MYRHIDLNRMKEIINHILIYSVEMINNNFLIKSSLSFN